MQHNTELDFIRSIQASKKAQQDWAQKAWPERSSLIRVWLQQLGEQIRNNKIFLQHLADLQGLSVEQQLRYEIEPGLSLAIQSTEQSVKNNYYAVGMCSLIAPQVFALRFILEKLVPCLLAGNGVFLKLPPDHSLLFERLRHSLMSQSWAQDLIQIFIGDEALTELMISHPVVQSVIFSGSNQLAERVISTASANRKRMQIYSGFHNSALLMQELSIQNCYELATACLMAGGRLPWSVSNILLLESQLEDFKQKFLPVLQSFPANRFLPADKLRLQLIEKQLHEEKAKIIRPFVFHEENENLFVEPLVVQDLTHCSTLYQDCLLAPVIFLSPVKYTHEMVRWNNNSYYGQCALLFATDEQVQKFAPRLEVAQVFVNHWLPSSASWLPGWKQSFYGNADQQIFGSFHSQRQSVDVD